MRANFVDNERSRPLVTVREDELIWQGHEMIDPIPEGAIVRAYIPADASEANVERALATIRARAASVAVYRMPKGKYVLPVPSREEKRSVRTVIFSLIADPDLIPLIEEACGSAGL